MYNLPSNKCFMVSVKALIVEKNKILFLKNNNDLTGSDGTVSKWELPGGLVDINESFENALQREALEEMNVKIKIVKQVSLHDRWWNNFTFADGRIMDVRQIAVGYLCKLENGKINLSNEHKDFQWIGIYDLKNINIAENSKNLITKYLSG